MPIFKINLAKSVTVKVHCVETLEEAIAFARDCADTGRYDRLFEDAAIVTLGGFLNQLDLEKCGGASAVGVDCHG